MADDAPSWAARVRRLLPRGWFAEPGTTPILDGILAAFAYAHAQTSTWIAFARQQTRLATATDDFLNGVAEDFLGTRVSHADGETDAAFRTRIRREILRPRATRSAMVAALEDLTGQTPLIVEPASPTDCGGYGVACGYGVVGAYGSLSLPFQSFITVYRPHVGGMASVDGYGGSIGGYGVGAIEYVSGVEAVGVEDAAIYSVIEATRPVATVMWVRLTNTPPTGTQTLDDSFLLDESDMT